MRRVRPFVTLTYAQSIDGSIAARDGAPIRLSCDESMKMTHELRASHDGILVGVNTVINDDPLLTLKQMDGVNPQPIVLDSTLRIPLTARLLKHPSHPLWVAASRPDPQRQTQLEALGARIIRADSDSRGHVNLASLLDQLGELGIKRLMIEGGATVIQSFLTQHLADKLIITISPQLLNGLKIDSTATLDNVQYRQLGIDLIVEADLISNV
ncbi:MAG: dihydrofolate reductase family protein [Chloroflexi bacterium]|nr:dihydrofolate reductase family protein [Chloroflexota bacterium]